MLKIPNYQKELANNCFNEILDNFKGSLDEFDNKIVLNITFKFKSDSEIDDCGTVTGAVNFRWHNVFNFCNRVSRSIKQNFTEPGEIKEGPLVYFFLEPSGHKFANKIGQIKDLHFHTVWILNVNHRDSIEDVRNKMENLSEFNFSNIFVQNVEFDEKNLGNIWDVLDYNSKFQRLLQFDLQIEHSYDKYPRQKNA